MIVENMVANNLAMKLEPLYLSRKSGMQKLYNQCVKRHQSRRTLFASQGG